MAYDLPPAPKPDKPAAAPLSSKRATQTGQMKALAKSATDEMLEVLAEIARDTDAPHSARVTAANSLLDRGHGKPVQQVQVGELGILDDLTDEQLDEMSIDAAQKLLSERGLTHH